jgi:hypothetical protein
MNRQIGTPSTRSARWKIDRFVPSRHSALRFMERRCPELKGRGRLAILHPLNRGLPNGGMRPNLKKLAPEVGLEPTTHRLTADCSTIELLWNPKRTRNLQTTAPPVNLISPNYTCFFLIKLFYLRSTRPLPSIARWMAWSLRRRKSGRIRREYRRNCKYQSSAQGSGRRISWFSPIAAALPWHRQKFMVNGQKFRKTPH